MFRRGTKAKVKHGARLRRPQIFILIPLPRLMYPQRLSLKELLCLSEQM